jgi:ribosomal protein S27AE
MGVTNGIKYTTCDYEEQFQLDEGAMDYYYRNGIYTPDYKCPICNNQVHLLHHNEIKVCPERIEITVENVTYQHKCPKCGAATCEDEAWKYGCFD